MENPTTLKGQPIALWYAALPLVEYLRNEGSPAYVIVTKTGAELVVAREAVQFPIKPDAVKSSAAFNSLGRDFETGLSGRCPLPPGD